MSRELLPVASARETSRLAWQLLASRRGALTVTVVAFALTGLTGLVAPWVLGHIVDDVRQGADSSAVYQGAIAIAVAAVVGAITTALSVGALAAASEPALASLREDVLSRALHLDSERIEAAGVGDVLSRVGDDVRTVAQSLVDVVPLVVNSLVAIVFTGLGLFALDWRLGLAGLASAPFYLIALRWYLPRSGPYYRRERIAQGERAEALVTGIQGASTLRAFGRDAAWLDRITHYSRHAATISNDVWGLLLRFFARNNRAELVGLLLVLGTGFLLVRGDFVTVGAVTAAALYFHRLFNPIGAILVTFDDVQSAGASLARLAGVAMLAPPSSEGDHGISGSTLELRGVGHAYVEGRPVLADIVLTVAPGERLALVGATGAGKTTLGAIAAGIIRPVTGTVVLGGTSYDELDEATIRQHVALITQDVHVFAGTVRQNVTLSKADASDADVERALRTTLAWRWVQALPEGLSTIVGDHGHSLTSSQAQQLALARLVLHDPLVAVFDEATAEAGSSGARELEDAARAAAAGRSAIIVAHRLTQARDADRVVVLHDGRMVEVGTHDVLVAAGGRYAELWAAWSAP